MSSTKRKTPQDVTEFEREQLRHLLSANDDLAATLAEINPSLAWLSSFGEMKLIQSGTQLAPWVQRNFTETDAVKEVAANIRYFTSEAAADVLEHGLNRQVDTLPPLLIQCWRLIIRFLRESKRGGFSEWFDLAPRIQRGDYSHEVLNRLADLLRPKLVIRGKPDWHWPRDSSEPLRPADLMSIEYEVDDLTNEKEVLAVWPEAAPTEEDARLLTLLTESLDRALADATEAGVESEGYSTSDSDVPSVAQHPQNEYHSGFIFIVRVMADIWSRLAAKAPAIALEFVDRWYRGDFKLVRRLALFACCSDVVPSSTITDALMALPLGEWFLANSSVEVYRLLRTRWPHLSQEQRTQIEKRIAEGPPEDRFREGADIRGVVDRCQYDLLGDLERRGFELSESSTSLLQEIRSRHPEWRLRPEEQAGFHIWSGGVRSVTGDSEALNQVPDSELVDRAEAIQSQDEFEGDVWAALCQNDPPRALSGLVSKAKQSEWPKQAWSSFLWNAPKLVKPGEVEAVAELLQQMPDETLAEITSVASFWLNAKAKEIEEGALWSLWDRIFTHTADSTPANLTMRDVFTDALNAPGGRLAEVVLKKVVKSDSGIELPENISSRLEKLVHAGGQFGLLARVRLAADVSVLFEIAPLWTTERIIPLFKWSSSEALVVWSARKYSRYIGSPKLFALLKDPFLQMFGRADVPGDDIQTYAGWLAAILLATRAGTVDYTISATEARSALRKAGPKGLSSFGHRLAIEMQSAKDGDKSAIWSTIVGPVFRNVWPLDAELQTSATTFKLVQILMATGAAFGEAADIIIPFVRHENSGANTTVFSISHASEIIYRASPEKVLDLLDAVVADAPPRSVHGLKEALQRLEINRPSLANTRRFQHLVSAAMVY